MRRFRVPVASPFAFRSDADRRRTEVAGQHAVCRWTHTGESLATHQAPVAELPRVSLGTGCQPWTLCNVERTLADQNGRRLPFLNEAGELDGVRPQSRRARRNYFVF